MEKLITINKITKNIKLLILDVDGVLTDGGLYFNEKGEELKCFNSLDGHGIKMLLNNCIEVAIISARINKTVKFRAKNLNIKYCYLGIDNKKEIFLKLLKILNLDKNQVAYIGDDVLDLTVMTKIALPIAVKNAHIEVKNIAKYITKEKGGYGAVREVCDMLLKAQNKYTKVMRQYLT